MVVRAAEPQVAVVVLGAAALVPARALVVAAREAAPAEAGAGDSPKSEPSATSPKPTAFRRCAAKAANRLGTERTPSER